MDIKDIENFCFELLKNDYINVNNTNINKLSFNEFIHYVWTNMSTYHDDINRLVKEMEIIDEKYYHLFE